MQNGPLGYTMHSMRHPPVGPRPPSRLGELAMPRPVPYAVQPYPSQASKGWMEALQLHWQIAQYWSLGFIALCVMLVLLEGVRRDCTRKHSTHSMQHVTQAVP